MRKRVIIFVLAAVAVVSTLALSGCFHKESEEVEEVPKLEKYVSEEDRVPYDYIEEVTYRSGDVAASSYKIKDAEKEDIQDYMGRSEKSGVVLEQRLVQTDDPAATLSEWCIDYMAELEKNGVTSEPQLAVEPNLCTITYELEDGKVVYPCMTIFKTQTIHDDSSIESMIEIRNDKAKDDTSDLLNEIYEVVEIKLFEE